MKFLKRNPKLSNQNLAGLVQRFRFTLQNAELGVFRSVLNDSSRVFLNAPLDLGLFSEFGVLLLRSGWNSEFITLQQNQLLGF